MRWGAAVSVLVGCAADCSTLLRVAVAAAPPSREVAVPDAGPPSSAEGGAPRFLGEAPPPPASTATTTTTTLAPTFSATLLTVDYAALAQDADARRSFTFAASQAFVGAAPQLAGRGGVRIQLAEGSAPQSARVDAFVTLSPADPADDGGAGYDAVFPISCEAVTEAMLMRMSRMAALADVFVGPLDVADCTATGPVTVVTLGPGVAKRTTVIYGGGSSLSKWGGTVFGIVIALLLLLCLLAAAIFGRGALAAAIAQATQAPKEDAREVATATAGKDEYGTESLVSNESPQSPCDNVDAIIFATAEDDDTGDRAHGPGPLVGVGKACAEGRPRPKRKALDKKARNGGGNVLASYWPNWSGLLRPSE